MATRKAVFDSHISSLEAEGVVEFQLLRCGCRTAVWRTGRPRRELCWRHKHEWPKACPCGECQRLRDLTARALAFGDRLTAQMYREKRQAHECPREGAA